jgi:hypothetical protein
MKSNKFFAMAVLAAAVTMTSCNNEEELNDNNTPVEIRLSSALSVQTRAAYPGTDTQIPAGETVAVYVDEAPTGTQLYGNNELSANGTGGLTGGTAMYFPKSGNNVDIYAFHTNATLAADYPTTMLTHTVSADQSTAANYYLSDLLYAKAANESKQATVVNLTFYHLLSKVRIAVKAGAGLDAVDLENAKITIEGTKLEANFTPNKATDANNVTIAADGSVTPITVVDLGNGDITTGDFTSAVYHDAIIVPQTLTADTEFIKVQLVSGGVLSYKIPQNGVNFDRGKKYIYNITVNLSGLTVTSSIQTWTDGGTVNVDAVMQ